MKLQLPVVISYLHSRQSCSRSLLKQPLQKAESLQRVSLSSGGTFHSVCHTCHLSHCHQQHCHHCLLHSLALALLPLLLLLLLFSCALYGFNELL